MYQKQQEKQYSREGRFKCKSGQRSRFEYYDFEHEDAITL